MRRFCWLWAIGMVVTLGGCGRKSDPVESARLFFDQLGKGATSEAYSSAAFGFQSKQDVQLFAQRARELGFTEVVSSTWQAPEIEGRSAHVRGEVVDKTGATMPLQVVLSQESGVWRVFAIKKPKEIATGQAANLFAPSGKGSGFTTAIDRPMPDDKKIRELTTETMFLFHEALQQKSFVDFYENVSRAWKVNLTTGALQRAFQPFIDKQINLEGIRTTEAVLEPASFISSDGFLVITGYYPLKPYKIVFSLKFIYELPNWKLFGIDINVQEPKADG
ncbi:MAG: hypothetical protein V4710_11540 [Verrucomicrobiota bacterium]